MIRRIPQYMSGHAAATENVAGSLDVTAPDANLLAVC